MDLPSSCSLDAASTRREHKHESRKTKDGDRPISKHSDNCSTMQTVNGKLRHRAHQVQHQVEGLACKVKEEVEDIAHKLKDEVEDIAHRVKEEVEEVAHKIYEAGWRVVHHSSLPEWMKDNDYIEHGHRPELQSYQECFRSIFRIHSETGNIWTHLLGMMTFVGISGYFLTRPLEEVQLEEKAVFSLFFLGVIVCLGFSWTFHTMFCHSSSVSRIMNKLDYVGISVLTIGSFVPWLYYCFYCHTVARMCYVALIILLSCISAVVSLLDFFQTPAYRAVRAAMFVAMGLSGVIPAVHLVFILGFSGAVQYASLGWVLLEAFLYISGAFIYAVRVPERYWPGKFNIWFQSHQIFHVFVVIGALVHYHGIIQVANYKLTDGRCSDYDFLTT